MEGIFNFGAEDAWLCLGKECNGDSIRRKTLLDGLKARKGEERVYLLELI